MSGCDIRLAFPYRQGQYTAVQKMRTIVPVVLHQISWFLCLDWSEKGES